MIGYTKLERRLMRSQFVHSERCCWNTRVQNWISVQFTCCKQTFTVITRCFSHRANGQVSFRETSRRCHVALNSSPAIRGHVKQGIAMVYHILHPRHPLNEERVLSYHSPLSRTRHNQYYAAGVLACARRESATQRSGITFLYRAHCGKMTPSIESEVHNIAQHRQRASKPQP